MEKQREIGDSSILVCYIRIEVPAMWNPWRNEYKVPAREGFHRISNHALTCTGNDIGEFPGILLMKTDLLFGRKAHVIEAEGFVFCNMLHRH